MRALALPFNDFKSIDPLKNEKCLSFVSSFLLDTRLKRTHVEYLFQCFVNFLPRNFYKEISPGFRDRPLERFWGREEVQNKNIFVQGKIL